MRLILATAGLAAVLALVGCGSDYRPPEFEVTGVPAAPVGQQIDIDVVLPGIVVGGIPGAGVRLEMRLDIEGGGPGKHDARVIPIRATASGRRVDFENISGAGTSVTIGPDRWFTGRIGALRVGNTSFEMMLDGVPEPGGRAVSGDARESQTGTPGTFEGWRRQRFLAAVTDFSAGRVAEIAWVRDRAIEVRHDLAPTSGDPFVRRSGGAVFIVNRFLADNIQRLDPQDRFSTSWQRSVRTGSNPHDVLVVPGERAYVTRYEPPWNDVAVIDMRDGRTLDSILLSGLAENPDETPRADRMLAVDGDVFVLLQDVDRSFRGFREGKIAVIDPDLDEITGVIPLGGKNPVDLELVPGTEDHPRVAVVLAGILPGLQARELSGGIVVVDAVSRAVERVVLDDDDVDANLSALALPTESLGYVVATDPSYRNRVLAFDLATGEVLRTVYESPDLVAELEVGGGILAIPDGSYLAPRVCLFRVPDDPRGTETPLGCAAMQLGPFSVEPLD